MKKMRLVSIVLGVLILAGMMMSGVALAQVVEEPVQEETITIPDYENFPFKHRLSHIDKNGKVDYTEDYYIEKFETTDKRITLSKFLEESVAVPSDPTDEAVAVIRFKNAVVIRTSPHSAITLLAWIPDEVLLTVLNRPDVLAPPSRIIIKISDLDKMNSIARCAIKENGHQWKFIDEQTHLEKLAELKESTNAKLNCETLWWYDDEHYYCQQKEFCGMYMYEGLHVFKTKAECEEALRNSIPDYENFSYKSDDFYEDDILRYDQYYYVREFKSTDKQITFESLMKHALEANPEDQEEQIALITLKDVIIITKATIGDSFSDTILIWIPEASISVVEIASNYIVVKSGDWEDRMSAARYAIKENGKWKFVDHETVQARGEEFTRIYMEKLKESKEK